MAKARLTSVTKKWIEGKTDKQYNSKTESSLSVKESRRADPVDRMKQTIYISKEANKLLWYNRVETGKTLSAAIEGLVLEHLAKK